MLIKISKLNENYNFLLLSILIAGWGLSCSSSFANFPRFRGGGELPLPPLATPLLYIETNTITKILNFLIHDSDDTYTIILGLQLKHVVPLFLIWCTTVKYYWFCFSNPSEGKICFSQFTLFYRVECENLFCETNIKDKTKILWNNI